MTTVPTDPATQLTKRESFAQTAQAALLGRGLDSTRAAVQAASAANSLVDALNLSPEDLAAALGASGDRASLIKTIMGMYGWPSGLGPIETADAAVLARVAASQSYHATNSPNTAWVWTGASS